MRNNFTITIKMTECISLKIGVYLIIITNKNHFTFPHFSFFIFHFLTSALSKICQFRLFYVLLLLAVFRNKLFFHQQLHLRDQYR